MFFIVLFLASLIPGGECHNVHPFVMAWRTTVEETCLTFANAALRQMVVVEAAPNQWCTAKNVKILIDEPDQAI